MSDVPKKITGLQEVRDQYDLLLCDVWGVIHNGLRTFPGVVKALKAWKKSGGKVLLLTNAPRPNPVVRQRLKELGCPPTAYDDILSSGDMARHMLAERAKKNEICHFVGAGKDVELLNGIDIDYAPAHEADFVLLAGMNDDQNETLEDYRAQIDTWHANNLPVICANPDRIVQIGSEVIYCAGALADIHVENGGTVIWLGKPHQPIYDMAKQQARKLTGLKAPRILAAGDGFKTDIPGANQAGLDVIFVTGGLAETLDTPPDTPQKTAKILRTEGGAQTQATYFIKHLLW